jgi:fatty acid synthase subunit alpha, fungi type
MSHSSPVLSMASTRSSTLRQLTLTSPLFCNGLVAVLMVTTHSESFEDFHQPILATYSTIRNITLVAGSGFGGSEDTWPYLFRDWSKEFGVESIPFDVFLFGSRVIVAKEAHTSSSVKDLIVAAAGADDAQWQGTYARDTGGIITVRSELGEPIHKVNNRALRLWKGYDDSVSKLPHEKRGAWPQERRAEVIKRLNADYFKPWFPVKKEGRVVEDLSDMTYEEVVHRLIRFMYVVHEGRWPDVSLHNLTGDWLHRVEERFAGVNGGRPKTSLKHSLTSRPPLSPLSLRCILLQGTAFGPRRKVILPQYHAAFRPKVRAIHSNFR